MGIEKGVEWGAPGVFPSDAPVAQTDADVAALEVAGASVIGLSGGDLGRTLGARLPFDPSGIKQLLPIDVVEIELDGDVQHICVAHTIVGRFLRQRETTAIMNAAFNGAFNIAPRAHPGDGKVDVVSMNLSVGDRLKARRRMVSGTHVPHPGIKIRRDVQGLVEYERPRQIRIDGEIVGRSSVVRYRVGRLR